MMFQVKQFYELTLEELNAIYIARSQVFTVGQQLTVQEPDLVDRHAVHVFHADSNGTVLAYLRLIHLETLTDSHYPQVTAAYAISRVAVVPEARGRGLGRKILERALEWVSAETKAEKVLIDAQSYLKDTYYAPARFVQVGEEFEEVGLPHVKMILEVPRP
ncbi:MULTISPECIES: GNAT family N-acetyltransferase [unclassified Rothia (in: high G+C Gram-positive bacteria)]|uniref:GNAT family N-acetyltransferase n=1 Tax=unclassified Rothia (in: high G+C Gram-positive bacteria) TaxID=2689056 RepID=UPI00195AB3B2|nr:MULTISPECIES: GNAT family N-acetyltransferase [unclassified Rothia (in: high G+C Gram-positive bacteria)]MBM7052164.1 GNAT family N-acetyltransferase [Rothia sp. ZJ1223]QRZ61405.1 GNAT family N-acetyltransferase [Rothia sp. ZJ932]